MLSAQDRLSEFLRRTIPNSGQFVLTLVAGFVGWGLMLSPAIETYASAVAAASRWFLGSVTLQPGTSVELTASFPRFAWTVRSSSGEAFKDSVSTWLVCYNSVLYLSLLTACCLRHPLRALGFAATGLPVLFLFHAADVVLAVESRLQTRLFHEHYAFWESFSLRFAVAKFLHHFSMMALKQVLPILLIAVQFVVCPQSTAVIGMSGDDPP